jgi:hypothetical protein
MGSEVAELKKLVESLSKEVTRLAGEPVQHINQTSSILMHEFQMRGTLRNCTLSTGTI